MSHNTRITSQGGKESETIHKCFQHHRKTFLTAAHRPQQNDARSHGKNKNTQPNKFSHGGLGSSAFQ
eukprot:7676179-Prorocentrum_lima.AAC.1